MIMNLLSIGILATQVAVAPQAVAASQRAYAPDGTQIIRVAADCSGAAKKVIRETGGQLLSASLKGTKCVITVLIPGKNNERPKKVTVSVRQ